MLLQASDSVSLDLLTYTDLESLRQRKSGSAAKTSIPQQRTVTLNSKRYLILTYTVEFDRYLHFIKDDICLFKRKSFGIGD